jgi:tripartite-type tricarboxylate transporter receptor subunit TctC
MIKKILTSILAAVAVTTAQANPAVTPVTLIVPLGAGSSTDTLARIVASELSQQGTPTIVINRPGADGIIGVNQAAEARPDGKTLVVGSGGTMSLLPLSGEPSMKFTENTFIPVAYLASASPVLTVHPKFPANNLRELVELIRRDPDRYPVGSFSKSSDLQARAIFALAGATPTLVPYKGTMQSATDVAGGTLALGIQPLPVVRELVRGGKLKVLATFADQRDREFPEVMSISEMNGVSSTYWFGIFAPPGTSPELVRQLNTAINNAMRSATVTAQMADMSYNTRIMTQEQFRSFYQRDVQNARTMLNRR